MAKAMARAYGDVRKGRTTLALVALAGAAWLLQAVAFALAGSPRAPPNVLTARGAEEESVGYLPSKMTELRVGQALQGIVTQVRERIALVDIGVEKAVAFALAGSPRAPPNVLTARGAEEESVGYLPSKMTELRVGQALQGIVTQVRERIALVDIGVEKVGLLPISKLLDGRAPDRVSEVLQEGDPITVYVAEVINPQEPRSRDSKLVLAGHKNKIVNLMQFGNRSNIEDVKAVAEAQKEKVYYKGLVTAVKDIGVVVAFRIPDVPGITSGLVYKTEVQGAPDIMSEVQVRILEVLIESRRRQVKLSMRDEDPLAGRAARFGDFRDMVEKTVKGKVTGFQDYGAFVEVVSDSGTTQRALLPNGEIKADRVPQDPAEVLEVGQELNLKILEITEKGIRVSQKEAEA